MSRLIYFTGSFPFSIDYTWKLKELEIAPNYFDEVIVIPFYFKKPNVKKFNKKIKVFKPTIGKHIYAKIYYFHHIFRSPFSIFEKIISLLGAIHNGKKAVVNWYLSSVYSSLCLDSDAFDYLKINAAESSSTVLFFQWTMNNALLIPYLYKLGYKNIVCRMHGYDLYEFRHNNHIPYKRLMLKYASKCTFISQHGKKYLEQKYPFVQNKSCIHYLGADPIESLPISESSLYHIISIARVVPLKRIHLIAESLVNVDYDIKWTHIGDGEEFGKLKEFVIKATNQNKKLDIDLVGWKSPNEIKEFYNKNQIHALVLVSETEGLPLAIMEAFSASIPVIATAVGGVPELVNSDNGFLLKKEFSITELTNAINTILTEPIQQKLKRRAEAYDTYNNKFRLKANTEQFLIFLKEQLEW